MTPRLRSAGTASVSGASPGWSVAPVLGRLHLLEPGRPRGVVEVPGVELEGDAETVGGMGVHGMDDVPDDPDAAFGDRLPRLVHVALVLEPDVVRPVASVDEVL